MFGKIFSLYAIKNYTCSNIVNIQVIIIQDYLCGNMLVPLLCI